MGFNSGFKGLMSDTDLCLGLITNPEEPYPVWCV